MVLSRYANHLEFIVANARRIECLDLFVNFKVHGIAVSKVGVHERLYIFPFELMLNQSVCEESPSLLRECGLGAPVLIGRAAVHPGLIRYAVKQVPLQGSPRLFYSLGE